MQATTTCQAGLPRRSSSSTTPRRMPTTGFATETVATVSVANPVVGILLGVVLLDERLSRPAWHVVVACIGLGVALAGAVAISLAREADAERDPPVVPATGAVSA